MPDLVSRERDAARRKPMLIGASVILLAGLGAWAGFSASKNSRMAEELDSLQAKADGLEKFAKPLKGLAAQEKEMEALGSQLVDAQSARVLWVDIWDDLGNCFASDNVWLADFDPVVGYEIEEAGGDAAQSVVVSDFTGSDYGKSSLAKLKIDCPTYT